MNKENTFLKLMRWMCNILQWLYWIVVGVMGILFWSPSLIRNG